jgi:hypothetical protein
MNLAEISGRLNRFLYRQHIRRLGPADIQLARDWSMALIRREHPHLTPEQMERFYENLLHLQVTAVDEWSRRMG